MDAMDEWHGMAWHGMAWHGDLKIDHIVSDLYVYM